MPRHRARFAVLLTVGAGLVIGGVAVPAMADPDLLAHWTFEGSSLADSSGNGLTLGATGPVTFGPGPRNSAVTFANGTSSAGVVSGTLTPGVRAWSVAAWCRVAPDTTQSRAIVTWYRCGANAACGLPDAALYDLLVAPSGRVVWYLRDGTGREAVDTSSVSIADGEWHHVAGTLEPASGRVALYVDGSLADTVQVPLGPLDTGGNSVPLSLGRIFRQGWGVPDNYLSGSLDDVRIYSRALSAAEVSALFVGVPAGVGPRGGATAAELGHARPEPFRTSTRIPFTLGEARRVRLTVHDLAGRELARPFEGSLAPGAHAVAWDGRDGAGAPLPAGVYFYRLTCERTGAGAVTFTRRGTLIR